MNPAVKLADRIAFDPALGWPTVIALGLAAAAFLVFYALRGGRAVILRTLGLTLILIGLMQPNLVRETREPTNDIAAIVIDQSESLALAGRLDAAREAGAALADRLANESGLDVRVREVKGGPDGTALVAALQDVLADAPKDRVAGSILLTDGQVSDAPSDPGKLRELGPVHSLIVGDPNRGDRRLDLMSAPAFGIVGEPFTLQARIEDPNSAAVAAVKVTIDGQIVRQLTAPVGKPFTISAITPKRGPNMVVVEAAAGPSEISLANNRAAFSLQGVRDRLRVLLITGEPYPGARVWRNLLKSDPAVDLIHFTILRPPEKQDETPLDELALIAFPTRELFVDKLDQFDLIIFDRYRRRSILPQAYFENIAQRVENGGALLIAAGPWDSTDESLFRTPLAAILPSQPTGRVIEQPFRPTITALGARHPVVRGLPDPERWGRWTREIEAVAGSGQTVLSGADGKPLLVLDHVQKGRVAQLWSDQAWLWARGYDGGGPHGELLRRLAHWLMQEPELEEERLTLEAGPQGLIAERASLGGQPGPIDIVNPSGKITRQTPNEAAPGLWRTVWPAEEAGLYEARSGSLRAFAAVGPLNPKEAATLSATPDILAPLAKATGGGAIVLGESGAPLPEIRRVDKNAAASGAGWIGLKRNGAYVVRASAAEPLGPGLAWAGLGLVLLMLGWRRESS